MGIYDNVKKEHLFVFLLLLSALIIFNSFSDQFGYTGLVTQTSEDSVTGYGIIDDVTSYFKNIFSRETVGRAMDDGGEVGDFCTEHKLCKSGLCDMPTRKCALKPNNYDCKDSSQCESNYCYYTPESKTVTVCTDKIPVFSKSNGQTCIDSTECQSKLCNAGVCSDGSVNPFAKITADDVYVLSINGKTVGSDSRIATVEQYRDLTLNEGQNTILVYSEDWGGNQGVIFELLRGDTVIAKTDTEWEVCRLPDNFFSAVDPEVTYEDVATDYNLNDCQWFKAVLDSTKGAKPSDFRDAQWIWAGTSRDFTREGSSFVFRKAVTIESKTLLKPNGQSCSASNECQSNYCYYTPESKTVTVCTDKIPVFSKSNGQTCIDSTECQSKFCSPITFTCITEPTLKLNGDRCNSDNECATFYCFGLNGGQKFCSLKPVGASCTQGGQCLSDYCEGYLDGKCLLKDDGQVCSTNTQCKNNRCEQDIARNGKFCKSSSSLPSDSSEIIWDNPNLNYGVSDNRVNLRWNPAILKAAGSDTGLVVYEPSNYVTGNVVAFDSVVTFFKKLFGIGARGETVKSAQQPKVVYDIWRDGNFLSEAQNVECPANGECTYTDLVEKGKTYKYKVSARLDYQSPINPLSFSNEVTVVVRGEQSQTCFDKYKGQTICVGDTGCEWNAGTNNCQEKTIILTCSQKYTAANQGGAGN
ncbi:hypothetical protein HYT57_05625, partial [Candidatus Woesearchaeota archaeon]|nr:hypothetical protein [Candidatus Woesearchaeota archaeon]